MRHHFSILMNLTVLSCLTLVGANHLLYAQSAENEPVQQADPADVTVTQIAGMPDTKQNVKGVLELDAEGLIFSNSSIHASIPLNRIEAVSFGDERYEPGGKAGAIVRKLIPYGGGEAVGVIQGKTVDILTVEYRDTDDGYHGAVFVLPKKQTADIKRTLKASIRPLSKASAASCEAKRTPDSVLVAPINFTGVKLPAEYRVLLYEQLIEELRQTDPSNDYVRAGDASAGSECTCTAMTLTLDVNSFKKGNAALRGSTGPFGMFLGTTSMGYTVKLTDQSHRVLFDAHMKDKHRLDTQTLSLAQQVARNVSKQLNKGMKSTSSSHADM
jgi:hypothetical protein